MRISIVRSLVVGCLMAVPMSASAATFYVDAAAGDDANDGSSGMPKATIQAAIDTAAATPGDDIVAIWAGNEYNENLTIMDSEGIVLAGIGEGKPIIAADDPGLDTVYVDAGSVELYNLVITGGDDAVHVENNYGLVPRLGMFYIDAINNGDGGLEVDDVPDVFIEGGTYNDNGGDGIDIGNADTVTLHWCDASGNDDEGIEVDAVGFLRAEYAYTQANGGSGFGVSNVDTLEVEGGWFSSNGEDGLDLQGVSTINLDFVIALDNQESGLEYVTFDTVGELAILRSDFTGNGGDGVYIHEEGESIDVVYLIATSATGNAQSGFDIPISGAVDDYGYPNTSIENGEDDVLGAA